ncbi:hypothetical protein PENSPDRAFT_257352 [Peniophora sp. CONT]|nr:hypothetical protein PENSPDRAFT_257352 [Peniophora sp. CONT]
MALGRATSAPQDRTVWLLAIAARRVDTRLLCSSGSLTMLYHSSNRTHTYLARKDVQVAAHKRSHLNKLSSLAAYRGPGLGNISS